MAGAFGKNENSDWMFSERVSARELNLKVMKTSNKMKVAQTAFLMLRYLSQSFIFPDHSNMQIFS